MPTNISKNLGRATLVLIERLSASYTDGPTDGPASYADGPAPTPLPTHTFSYSVLGFWGCRASRFRGFRVLESHGFGVSRSRGFQVCGFVGFCWFLGFKVPRFFRFLCLRVLVL